jgi:hypothetical protein
MARQFVGDDDMEQEVAEWQLDVRGRLKELKEEKQTIQEEEEQLRKKSKLDSPADIFSKPKPVPPATNRVTIDVDAAKLVDDNSTLTDTTTPSSAPPCSTEQCLAALDKILNGNNLSMSPGVDKAEERAHEEALRMASVNGIICTLCPV